MQHNIITKSQYGCQMKGNFMGIIILHNKNFTVKDDEQKIPDFLTFIFVPAVQILQQYNNINKFL